MDVDDGGSGADFFGGVVVVTVDAAGAGAGAGEVVDMDGLSLMFNQDRRFSFVVIIFFFFFWRVSSLMSSV